MGLGSATALNMIDMIGVGPFITMPLVLSAMGGPQAMLGWVVGALLAVCDGLVSAELGAAMPGSGGPYRYLNEIYGPRKWGRLISFLFIWQLSFSAPLSIATGASASPGTPPTTGPAWKRFTPHTLRLLPIPWAGPLQVSWIVTQGTAVAVIICFLTVLLLYRRITVIGRLSKILWIGVMGTIGWIIFAGLTHFNAARAFDFPPGAFTLSHGFFTGLGGAMLVATYDYWGYYNVCYLGDEIKDPTRNIPRALLLSILLVACLYLMMNLCILAVVPWREMLQAGHNNNGLYVVSLFMQRIYGTVGGAAGHGADHRGRICVGLLADAGLFAGSVCGGSGWKLFQGICQGASGVPLSACFVAGTGVVAAAFCFLRLRDAIAALVVIRLILQFLVQAIGLIVFRVTRPEIRASVSHVAVSCAGVGRDCGISVYSVQSGELAKGNTVCGGYIVGWLDDLYDSSVERLGMAFCGRYLD